MNATPRPLKIFALCLLLLPTVSCVGEPNTTPYTLSSGRTIKVIAVGPMQAKFGRGLALSYQTDRGLSDVDALRKEVAEIWTDFRRDAEQAKVDFAVIMANEAPVGMIVSQNKVFNFVFERKPEVGWSEVGAKVEGAVIEHFGLFDLGSSVAQVASGTAAGRIHAWRQLPKWTGAPAKIGRTKGTFFGYEFVVQGQPASSPVDVKVVIEHPPFQAPGSNQPSTVESWIQPILLGVPSVIGYGFDEDWEMVAGTWTVRVYRGSRLLCERGFAVE